MKKRVLLVDDSKSALYALARLLESSGLFEVVGQAQSGAEAVALARATLPDLVTMDVYLDGQDGVDVTRSILAAVPTRIVLVTSLDPARADLAFRALAAGALDVLGKPPNEEDTGEHPRRRFLAALAALSDVALLSSSRSLPNRERPLVPSRGERRVLALGASTGGPQTLARILAALPVPFSLPVLIVQHIEEAHSRAFAQWLAQSGHEVRVVEQSLPLAPGAIYVACGGTHLTVDRAGRAVAKPGPPRNYQRPSVDELFESLARERPLDTFAALLTGMGEDGARGLHALAKAGATTVIQSLDSCVIPGMPSAALARIGGLIQLGPEEIARAAQRFAASSLGPRSNDI